MGSSFLTGGRPETRDKEHDRDPGRASGRIIGMFEEKWVVGRIGRSVDGEDQDPSGPAEN